MFSPAKPSPTTRRDNSRTIDSPVYARIVSFCSQSISFADWAAHGHIIFNDVSFGRGHSVAQIITNMAHVRGLYARPPAVMSLNGLWQLRHKPFEAVQFWYEDGVHNQIIEVAVAADVHHCINDGKDFIAVTVQDIADADAAQRETLEQRYKRMLYPRQAAA